jgi:hypothetical protein
MINLEEYVQLKTDPKLQDDAMFSVLWPSPVSWYHSLELRSHDS